MERITYPAVFMRGGTSKGIFFRKEVLPDDPALRDRILLRVLGSPDPYRRQIDGLGGASSSTSKAVLVSASQRPGIDVDYLFAQVDIERALVDYSGNCGNLSGAVGPFSISQGFVAAQEGITTVRIWQENTKRLILAHVPVKDGEPREEGDFVIDGVPFPGAEIALDFCDPGGSLTGKLLPTGNVMDELHVAGMNAPIRATLLDAGTAVVLIAADSLGLRGTELRPQIDNHPAMLAKIEAIRAAGSVAMGLAQNTEEASRRRPGTPKIAFVSPPQTYKAANGSVIEASQIDFVARMMSMGTLHHAYPGTGAIGTAIAAAVPGSIVNQVARPSSQLDRRVCFGHTSGTIAIGAAIEKIDGEWRATKARVSRSARQIMRGEVCVPASLVRTQSEGEREKLKTTAPARSR